MGPYLITLYLYGSRSCLRRPPWFLQSSKLDKLNTFEFLWQLKDTRGRTFRRQDTTYPAHCSLRLPLKHPGVSLCFWVEIFIRVFYMYGASFSFWDICILLVFSVLHLSHVRSTRPPAHCESCSRIPAVSSHGVTLTFFGHFTRGLSGKCNMSKVSDWEICIPTYSPSRDFSSIFSVNVKCKSSFRDWPVQ